jgi:hypothetical protein
VEASVPNLRDDPRYQAALERGEAMLAEELRTFRERVSTRMVGLVAIALDEMGERYNEPRLRRALASFDTVFIEESLAYIRRTLVRAGEIELAKRIGEAHDKINLGDLPPEFTAAWDELRKASLLEPPREPSLARLAEVN